MSAASGWVAVVADRLILGFTRAGTTSVECRSAAGARGTVRDWPLFMLSVSYETPDGRDLFIGGETENGNGKPAALAAK